MTTPTPTSRVSEAVARPARTVIQSGPGWVIIEVVEAYGLYDFTDRQYGVTLLLLTAAASVVQNFLENRRGKAFWLRSVPPKEVPAGGA